MSGRARVSSPINLICCSLKSLKRSFNIQQGRLPIGCEYCNILGGGLVISKQSSLLHHNETISKSAWETFRPIRDLQFWSRVLGIHSRLIITFLVYWQWSELQCVVPVLLPAGARECGHWDCPEEPHHGLPLSHLHPCQCSSTQVSREPSPLDGIKENSRLKQLVEKFPHFPPTLLISPRNIMKIWKLWKFKYQRRKVPFRDWIIENS